MKYTCTLWFESKEFSIENIATILGLEATTSRKLWEVYITKTGIQKKSQQNIWIYSEEGVNWQNLSLVVNNFIERIVFPRHTKIQELSIKYKSHVSIRYTTHDHHHWLLLNQSSIQSLAKANICFDTDWYLLSGEKKYSDWKRWEKYL